MTFALKLGPGFDPSSSVRRGSTLGAGRVAAAAAAVTAAAATAPAAFCHTRLCAPLRMATPCATASRS